MKSFVDALGIDRLEAGAPAAGEDARSVSLPAQHGFVATRPAGQADCKLAFATVAVSALLFLGAIPFAKQPLAPVWAFIPSYQAALVVCDLVTAALLFGQARFSRSAALFVLASGYLFTACLALSHALSFPGLFAPGGVLGGGTQSTAWLYMFWHAGFPLFVIAYALLRGASHTRATAELGGVLVGGVVAVAAALTWLATAGESALPPIMQGNRYTPAMIFVVSSVWLASLAALLALWRQRAYRVLDIWLMVVMCAWLFDIGLSAVFNAGRFDLGFYAGRIYGLAAASFVLVVLLLENTSLHGRLALEHERDQRSLARHSERLRILAAIDQAVIAEQSADAIAAAVIQPLRELLDVPRAIVNRFDLASGTVEWVAAAGRRRTHVGPGVRYSLALMGDVQALRKGEPQLIDVHALPPGTEVEALLASGVRWYMAMPMIAGGELIGALSFGGEGRDFRAEQLNIAREVAAQLAIATAQTRLLERVKAHAAELEAKVHERTAELESFSYSVSHDLRAPLRAIDGYARMLEEDYAGRLDAEAQRLIGVVRANARRMGQLIDDLLAFSRLSRQQPARARLDMSALACEVGHDLRGNRPATIEVAPLPPAQADAALLRQVWTNLIGNALKYSAKKAEARVDIGAREDAGETVYWVRDNGAGFDMRYAQKLFGVFQRLHRADEFEGTGVGLAIVQRIVARHGGRVWAEGEPGAGACFYFSLPKET
ncbi:MAG: GAF domain-containing protein [Betaproteobacteria bacterium]|nr:MAG: GAF domain-containing protein [Betaproteobacteria bacterium]